MPPMMRRLVPLAVLLWPAVALAGGFEDAARQGTAIAFLAAFGFGFLTSLTPCVYPMIPITLSLFGARSREEGQRVSRGRAVALATAYVAGIATTFGGLGAAVGGAGMAIFGTTKADVAFGALLGSPWFVVPLAILFAVLAASALDVFEIGLPGSVQARLQRVGGAGFGGAFLMGMVGGFIAAPCTGPPLAGMLVWVAASGSALLGFALLATYAAGIGVLFWVLAAFALSMPKSGRWMEVVRAVLGVAMLVAALYFLGGAYPSLRTIGQASAWFLGASLTLALLGVAVGGAHLSFRDLWPVRLRKALGVVLLTIGLYGGVLWALTPAHLPEWSHDETAAVARHRQEKRPLAVDFTASWCPGCLELRAKTFSDRAVAKELERFVLLEVDGSQPDEKFEDARERHGATTMPAVVLYDSTGRRAGYVGEFIPPAKMLEILRQVR
jgi:thiol:disulfide interchange protein DsbD